MALIDKLVAIGEAIREKTGGTERLTLDAMPQEIRSITTGGGGSGSSDDVRYVTFMSYDGIVEYGKKAVAVGDDCADPIVRGVFETPTRESDVQYDYSFDGWATSFNGEADENWNKDIKEDKIVYASFDSVVRKYTITYYDSDGSTVLKTEQIAYGTIPNYIPIKDKYNFVEWIPAPTAVVGNASYSAIWTEKPAFATATWDEIIDVAQNGNAASTFSVGDERTETIAYADGTTEQITWVIASMNQTCTTVDGNNDNMVVVAKHALLTKQIMNNSMSIQYERSNLANYLNGTFYDALPDSLQNAIKEVYTKNANYPAQKVWIPSLKDLGLSSIGSGTGPFEYFSTTDKRIMKLGANGTATEYWTREGEHSGMYTYFKTITASGIVTTSNYIRPNESYAVVPCFCI